MAGWNVPGGDISDSVVLRMKYGLRLIIFSQIAVVKIRRINMVF